MEYCKLQRRTHQSLWLLFLKSLMGSVTATAPPTIPEHWVLSATPMLSLTLLNTSTIEETVIPQKSSVTLR